TLAGVRQRCEAIDADSRAQAETMQQLDYLADQVLQQLSRTTAQMQELNQHTAVSSSQIEDCVSQMQEAENSMQARSEERRVGREWRQGGRRERRQSGR